MNTKLVVITEIIAPYRIPVFNLLGHQPGIDLHVIFLAETDSGLRKWMVYRDELKFSHEVLPSLRWSAGKRSVLFNWGVGSALRRAAPKVIICGGYSDLACWRAQQWALASHVPFLVWVESNTRDQRSENRLIEFLKARFLRACGGVIVAGKSSADYVRMFGVSQNRIFVAPNAVDNNLFARSAACARADVDSVRQKFDLPQRYFLYVGRFVREKGVFDLLHAYQSLPSDLRQEIGLVMVGDGPGDSELRKAAGDVAQGRVVFPGFLQRDQLGNIYGLAETFIFPTHSDTWGLSVNEAMACCLPVIITQVAGCVDDLVEDRWNGRVVHPKSPTQLAAAMTELARDSQVRTLMGERSLNRIGNYSPECCAAGMAAAALACGGLHVQ